MKQADKLWMVVLHACQYPIKNVFEENLAYKLRSNGQKQCSRVLQVLEIPQNYLRDRQVRKNIRFCISCFPANVSDYSTIITIIQYTRTTPPPPHYVIRGGRGSKTAELKMTPKKSSTWLVTFVMQKILLVDNLSTNNTSAVIYDA